MPSESFRPFVNGIYHWLKDDNDDDDVVNAKKLLGLFGYRIRGSGRMRIVTSHPPVRWITGRRSDDADPGGRVVATVHQPQRNSEWEASADIYCPYIHRSGDMRILGGDEAQSLELAIRMVLQLYEHYGVRDVEISLVPPDDLTC